MADHSDEELKLVLKKRKYYTPEAADLAINEAISRGILNSENDLVDEQFRTEEMQFSWFPVPDNETTRLKIRKSIIRILFFCGLIPLLFGFIETNSGNISEGKFFLGFALLWIALSARLLKNYHHLVLLLLHGASVTAVVYTLVHLLQAKTIVVMDVFIAIVLFLMVSYGLFYVRKIMQIETPD